MESPEPFIRYEPWTADEKKVARRAFEEVLAAISWLSLGETDDGQSG